MGIDYNSTVYTMVCQRPGLDNRSLICQSVFTLIDRRSRLSLALLFCFSLHRVLYLLVFLVTASLSDCLFDLTVKKKKKKALAVGVSSP